MEKSHCSCDIQHSAGNNSVSTAKRRLYFKPNKIFNEECFRKLIGHSTSEGNCISLSQIKSNDYRKISIRSKEAISIRILIAEPQRSLHSSMESIDEFPPVCVEPICTGTFKIDGKMGEVDWINERREYFQQICANSNVTCQINCLFKGNTNIIVLKISSTWIVFIVFAFANRMSSFLFNLSRLE